MGVGDEAQGDGADGDAHAELSCMTALRKPLARLIRAGGISV